MSSTIRISQGVHSICFDLLKKNAQNKIQYIEGGRQYLVTDLVLGTLTVSYDPQIQSGRSTQIDVGFKPHSILSDELLGDFIPDEVITRWHVRPEYRPRVVSAEYDYVRSGRVGEERTLNLRANREERWLWTVSAPPNFGTDTTDLLLNLGYSLSDGKETEEVVRREPIEWNARYEPGLLARAWSWVREFSGWLLTIIAALVGIVESLRTIKVRKLELELKGYREKLA